MIIFGIESSCDETSAAVIDAGDGGIHILSNVVATQIETHALYGGGVLLSMLKMVIHHPLLCFLFWILYLMSF